MNRLLLSSRRQQRILVPVLLRRRLGMFLAAMAAIGWTFEYFRGVHPV